MIEVSVYFHRAGKWLVIGAPKLTKYAHEILISVYILRVGAHIISGALRPTGYMYEIQTSVIFHSVGIAVVSGDLHFTGYAYEIEMSMYSYRRLKLIASGSSIAPRTERVREVSLLRQSEREGILSRQRKDNTPAHQRYTDCR